jgi:hypothetical protein
MASQLSAGRSAVDRLIGLIGLPGALVDSLRILPEIGRHTATLYEITALLKRIAGDTEALPPVRDNMALVAEATSVLGAMDERISTIEEAMPVLVEGPRRGLRAQMPSGDLPDARRRLTAHLLAGEWAMGRAASQIRRLRPTAEALARP